MVFTKQMQSPEWPYYACPFKNLKVALQINEIGVQHNINIF